MTSPLRTDDAPHDTFFALGTLGPDALDRLLGKASKARAPWWIHKGKVVIADAAHGAARRLDALAGLALRSDCHGPALA
jgi:hypothetical protein